MLKFWKRLNEFYGWFIIAVFSIIMLIGVWQVYDNYYLFSHTLDENVLRYKPDPTIAAEAAAAESSPISSGMVAWLTVDGTNIDFPVMQGENNSVYLNTDPFGAYSLSGSIFLDSRSSSDFSDGYSVIYGHHMDYGKMFGALDAFLDESYLDSHRTGTLMIGRYAPKVCDLEIFASMQVSAREPIVFDMKQDEIRQFIHEKADILKDEGDERILALSTCADADSLTRILVFCYIKDSTTS